MPSLSSTPHLPDAALSTHGPDELPKVRRPDASAPPGPGLRCPARRPPEERLVLPPGPHSPLARQGCTRRTANRAGGTRHDHHDSRSRWPTSSLRPPGSVVRRRRSSLPPNARHGSFLPAAPIVTGSGLTVRNRRSCLAKDSQALFHRADEPSRGVGSNAPS